jgi:hypothetical protein
LPSRTIAGLTWIITMVIAIPFAVGIRSLRHDDRITASPEAASIKEYGNNLGRSLSL